MDTKIDLDLLDNIDIKDLCKKKKKKSKYTKKYNKETTEYFKSCRVQAIDIILNERVDPKTSFKFEYTWNPYTGERLEKDPYGPLYFHPDSLIKYYYTNRMNKLWIYPDDTDAGYFSGMYDDAVGIGKDFICNGQPRPEWYLFRLPYIPCYLPKQYDMQIPTFGPKITDAEILEIENLANKYHRHNYEKNYIKKRPSLSKIKEYYDIAISKEPIKEFKIKTEMNDINIRFDAIKKLMDIKG